MASDFSQAFWSVTVAAGTLEALSCICTSTSSSAVLIFLTIALSKSLPFNLLSGADSWAFPLSFLFSGITLLMELDQELRRSLVGGSQHCCCQLMANLPCAGTELPEDLACLSSTAPLIARGHQWDLEGSGTQFYGKHNSSEGLCPNSFFCHLFIRFLLIKAGRMFSVPSYKWGY